MSVAELPDESRVWLFGLSRPVEAEHRAEIGRRLGAFLHEWTAHRAELRSGSAWLAERFLLVGVDESATRASGCSIDALVGALREIEVEAGCRLLDGDRVFYRDSSGVVRSVSRSEFRELAATGGVDAATPVFDLTVERLGNVRRGDWELAAGDSWHARLL